jgi:hypothetical protein
VDEEEGFLAATPSMAGVANIETKSFWDSQEFFMVSMVAVILGISLGTFLLVYLMR